MCCAGSSPSRRLAYFQHHSRPEFIASLSFGRLIAHTQLLLVTPGACKSPTAALGAFTANLTDLGETRRLQSSDPAEIRRAWFTIVTIACLCFRHRGWLPLPCYMQTSAGQVSGCLPRRIGGTKSTPSCHSTSTMQFFQREALFTCSRLGDCH